MAKVNRKAAKLHRSGTLPQATWAYQVKGLSPTNIRKLRAAMVRAVFPHSSAGLSTTTVIQVHYGVEADPAINLPLGILTYFIKRYQGSAELAEHIDMVWDDVHEHVKAGVTWARVTGPISAVIATILDLG